MTTTPRTYLGHTAAAWRKIRNRIVIVAAAPFVLAALNNNSVDATPVGSGAVVHVAAGITDRADGRNTGVERMAVDRPAAVPAPPVDSAPAPALSDAQLDEQEWAANRAQYGDCEEQGLITAEDYSCVGQSFYSGRGVVQEDSRSWSCQTMGNRVCGPGSGAPAGCYSGGALVIPWSNYSDPKADPLYGQLTAPC